MSSKELETNYNPWPLYLTGNLKDNSAINNITVKETVGDFERTITPRLYVKGNISVTNAGNITFDGSLATGFTSTYKEYIFKLIDIHPVTDNVDYLFGVDTSGNTNYNQPITSSSFDAYHNEADDATGLAYNTGMDLAQGTSGQKIFEDQGNDNDQCGCGILHIFDPTITI